MPEKPHSYPAPKAPLSFRQVVTKILADTGYAKFIHSEVVKARKGNATAAKTVAAHFEMLPEELKELSLPANFGSCINCTESKTNTTLFVLEFATPARIWPKKRKKD